ncbi:helix-turn-helix domain-containing protein [Streptomyces sp. NPDC001744]|uniref:helix-turn-helix domain-containing protein n=1 Tax=Streptomyces sp. NPDC001744 TaxID=3364606 RepID=UPI003677DC58
MCHPAWARARAVARHLDDLARLRRVRDLIDREYARPLDVGELARRAGMAPGHLSRAFRLAYGAPPHAYLTARRVERARTLLHHGDPGDAALGGLVGLLPPSAFRARFTELVGTPPDAYHRAAARRLPGVRGA